MTLGKRRAEWVLRLLAADVAALLVAFLVAYRLRAALDDPIGRVAAPLGYYLWLLGLIVPDVGRPARGLRRLRHGLDDALAVLARSPGGCRRARSPSPPASSSARRRRSTAACSSCSPA